MGAVIEMEDLTVRFPASGATVEALRGLSLSVPGGSVVGFLGPNGAGKTTAIHVLLGFIKPASGRAAIFGADVGTLPARERIGYLPEHPETYKFLSGRELLWMTGRLFNMARARLKETIAGILRRVGLEEAADRRIATYSRGMMQRIGLAQALINDPDLLILDEPTGGLDPLGRMDVRRLIADLKAAGKTVFFSSHELSEVELVCDHAVILAGGRLVAEGAVHELVGAGERLEQYFLRVIAGKGEAATPGRTPVGRSGA